MSLRFVDSPDRYVDGNGIDVNMLGVWAALPSAGGSGPNFQVVTPSFGSRTGQKAFFVATNSSTGDARFAIQGTALTEMFFAFAHYCEILPGSSLRQQIRFHDGSNNPVCYINVEPTGNIAFRDASDNLLGLTSTPAVFAEQWKFFELRVVTGAGTGVFELRDSTGVTLLSLSSLNIPGSIAIVVPRGQTGGVSADGKDFYLCDISVKGTDGTENNTWYPVGGVGNYLLRPIADVPGNEWDFVARRTYDNGVGDFTQDETNKGISVADAASLEIGASDFTIEGNFRWNVLPTAGQVQTLAGKWNATTLQSWRLYLYESGGNRFLAFEYSTDGTSGTATLVHDFPFEPVKWQKYNIAVSRDGGISRMFIDGVRVGPETADAATYFNGSAVLGIGGRQGTTTTLNDCFNGWADEVRFTVGVGRYTAEYTPSAVAFPRDVTGDPDFASVQLLVGFDNGLLIDQSSAGRPITSRGGVNALLTDDGFFGYQSIDKPFRDDTFVEAAYLPAEGTFELTANPLNGEEIVIGADTYTFNTVLGGAYSVLIGIDEDETLDNLIAAVEGGAGIGTIYGTGTVANADAGAEPLPGAIARIVALVPGTAGNSIVFTTDVTGAIISGSGTLTGGVDIPAASEYILERLPRGITRVDSVSLFTRRSAFGVGGAEMQPGFVDSSLAISAGVDASAPANPGWQVDIFNDNGGSGWTTTDLLGSKVRVDRTS